MHKMKKFHSYQVISHQAMVDAMEVKRSIYFATLQGYVIFETELYIEYARCSSQKISSPLIPGILKMVLTAFLEVA